MTDMWATAMDHVITVRDVLAVSGLSLMIIGTVGIFLALIFWR
jgi:hypothetical protein